MHENQQENVHWPNSGQFCRLVKNGEVDVNVLAFAGMYPHVSNRVLA